MFDDYDSKKITCFLCDHIFRSDEESWMIFDGHIHRSLSSILSSALRQEVHEKTAHSIFLCNGCKTLILEFGSLEQRFNEMRKEILTVYNRTAKLYNLAPILFDDNLEVDVKESDSCTMERDCSENEEKIIYVNVLNSVNDGTMIKTEELIINDINNSIEDRTDERNDAIESTLPLCKINSFSSKSTLNKDVENKDKQMECYYEENKLEINDKVEKAQPTIKREMVHNDYIKNFDKRNKDNEVESDIQFLKQNVEKLNENFEKSTILTALSQHTISIPVSSHEILKNTENVTDPNAEIITYDVRNKSFINKLTLKPHTKSMHSLSKESKINGSVACKECTKKFRCKARLLTHVNLYHTERECGICKEKFIIKSDFAQHLNMHVKRNKSNQIESAEKEKTTAKILSCAFDLYKCFDCHKFFCHKESLKLHMQNHNNIRYPCDICDKNFLTKKILKQHKMIHISKDKCEPRFECDICNKKFYLRTYLLQHSKRQHIEPTKSFECNICNKHFKTKGILKTHKMTHIAFKTFKVVHNFESFKCDICKKIFFNKNDLSKHLLNHNTAASLLFDGNLELAATVKDSSPMDGDCSENEDESFENTMNIPNDEFVIKTEEFISENVNIR